MHIRLMVCLCHCYIRSRGAFLLLCMQHKWSVILSCVRHKLRGHWSRRFLRLLLQHRLSEVMRPKKRRILELQEAGATRHDIQHFEIGAMFVQLRAKIRLLSCRTMNNENTCKIEDETSPPPFKHVVSFLGHPRWHLCSSYFPRPDAPAKNI